MHIGEHVEVVVPGATNVIRLLWKLAEEARAEISHDRQCVFGKLSMIASRAELLEGAAQLDSTR
jgi:hypothetical protein